MYKCKNAPTATSYRHEIAFAFRWFIPQTWTELTILPVIREALMCFFRVRASFIGDSRI